MDNQTRNHLNLQKHIADQDHIIRVRNAEIAALRKRAEKAERERDEANERAEKHRRSWMQTSEEWQTTAEEWERRALEARKEWDDYRHDARAAESALSRVRAALGLPDDATTDDMVEAAEQSRTLTADDITDEMIQRMVDVYQRYTGRSLAGWIAKGILTASLTEPTRPEGAEKVEAVLHQYWSGDINGDDLADRIAEEMNR